MARSISTAISGGLWARRINAALQSALNGAFEAGDLLIQAKTNLSHGAYEKMVLTDLRCDPRTAQRLVAVAKDERIRRNASLLPLAWTTLFELTKLSDAAFQAALDAGTLTVKTKRKDVPQLADQRENVTDAESQDLDPRTGEVLGGADETPGDQPEQASADLAEDATPRGRGDDPSACDVADVALVVAIVTGPPNGGDTEGHKQHEIIAAAQEPCPIHLGNTDAEAAQADVEVPEQESDRSEKAMDEPRTAEAHPSSEGGHIPEPAGSLAPAIIPDGDTVTLTRAQYDALVKRASASPWLIVGEPVSAVQYCLSLLRSATTKIEAYEAAERYAAAMCRDDVTRIIVWLNEFEQAFRHRFDVGTPAALDRDAA